MNIYIDRNMPLIPTDFSWQFGIGNDHACQMLRTDVCEHVKLAHDELGIRYIRFHGIFDDDLLVVQRLTDYHNFGAMPWAKGIEETSFRQIANVFDNVLACGMKPFVELSFMPRALASGSRIGLRYKNNITMPKFMERWCELIERFIRFLFARYGQDEVRSWYFEVWNEPDLPIFFKGKQKDYFALYAATAKTIKQVDKGLRVGGPSTSACLWIPGFIAYCESSNVPCDFVSTHHYPGDAFGNTFSIKDALKMMKTTRDNAKSEVDLGDTLTEYFFKPEVYKTWRKGVLREMDETARKEAGERPLFITEWNSMAVYASPVHDEKYSAAFLVKSVMDLKGVMDAYMFWCCSDVFEELFILGKPFHGSYGIVNNDGIPKPNFWGFKLLSGLYPKRLDLPITNDAVEYAAFVDGGRTQILLYAQDFDYNKDEAHEVCITINAPFKSATRQVIDSAHCNPKAEWIKLGQPDLLTREQVSAIKEATRLQAEPQAIELQDGETAISLRLRTNDVVLITLE